MFYGDLMQLLSILPTSNKSVYPLVAISLRDIFEKMELPYDMKNESTRILMQEVCRAGKDRDINISMNRDGINKITSTEYSSYKNEESLTKLVNKPNQKVVFNSNNHGVQSMSVKTTLKPSEKSPLDVMIEKATAALKQLSEKELAGLGRDKFGQLKK